MPSGNLTSNKKPDWLATVCRQSSIALIACLPFLAFLNPSQNIDMQGLLLIAAGGLGYLALGLNGQLQASFYSVNKIQRFLIVLFLGTGLFSLVVNPHKYYGLLGAPYLRLGWLSFVACLGCGLLIMGVARDKLVKYLYFELLGLAVFAIPYSLAKFHTLQRIGGSFAQADIMACLLAIGLLAGLYMFDICPKHKVWLAGSQSLLMVLLTLTETRAVIAATFILIVLWIIVHRKNQTQYQVGLFMVGGFLILGSFMYFFPSRLTNSRYAVDSFQYRISLQKAATSASLQKPVFGFGPGNLADALDCSTLKADSLKETCDQGFFFNSSHNIFLDRALSLGWAAGVAFLALVLTCLYRGIGHKEYVCSFLVILISLYYLTNVTSLVIELLLWILLLQLSKNSI